MPARCPAETSGASRRRTARPGTAGGRGGGGRAGAGGGRRGGPPLPRAAWHGRAAAARLLLDAGADLNAQARSHGLTPLQVAVRTGHAEPAAIVETVRLLLDAGADALIVDREGYWPRATARSLGRTALVAMLPAAAD